LLVHLSGRSSLASAGTIPDRTILVARSMGPAELLDYDREQLCGIVLEDGSTTSHVAIIAKALEIPIVGRCLEAMSLIEPFDRVIIDGDNAHVFIRPAEDVQAAFRENMVLRTQRRRAYAELAPLPAVSLDGVRVSLNLNAGLLVDVPHLADTGAEGIGLYRTEIPFMVRPSYPDVEEQTALYQRVLDLAGDKPVQFRTLDIGGDKLLPYFGKEQGENPALGWRAIRIGLDRPAMLRQQIRALLRAAAGRTLSVMFPLVADVTEFDDARALLDREVARAEAEGYAPDGLRVGVMLEVPALLWQLPALLARTDFVAVGSNDLMQYLFAADRCDPAVAHRFDALSPAAFAVFDQLLAACNAAGKPLSVCGEIAARPLDAMALVGLGFRNLSMPPANVGPVKSMIRHLPVVQLAEYMHNLRNPPRRSLRQHLAAFARDHRIPV
ncbi:MAG: peptidase, partial [Alphaproteobacteria bacterium]|nr:peptidase [Alphaproteobacteria bacterium]